MHTCNDTLSLSLRQLVQDTGGLSVDIKLYGVCYTSLLFIPQGAETQESLQKSQAKQITAQETQPISEQSKEKALGEQRKIEDTISPKTDEGRKHFSKPRQICFKVSSPPNNIYFPSDTMFTL